MAVQLVLLKRMLVIQDQRMALAGPHIQCFISLHPRLPRSSHRYSTAQSNILYMYDYLPPNAYLTGRYLVASTDKDSVSGLGSYQNIDEDSVARVKAAV